MSFSKKFWHMKRIFLTLIIIFILSLFFFSCYYDNEEALYPAIDTTCDTTVVTYSGTIVNMMSNNCYMCHSNKTAAANGSNIRLEDYSDVVVRSNIITQSIKHTGSSIPMPKNGGKIKSCYITQWDIWVRKGMVNN
jgi:thioredoxin-related protein